MPHRGAFAQGIRAARARVSAGGMMARMRPTLSLGCAGCVLALAACGGGDGADDDRLTLTTPGVEEQRAAPPDPVREVDEADVRVVRAWADTLRRGDVRGAARYFALPSVVANGTRPIKLETRAEVRFFNRTLPCGAKVIGTEARTKGFFIATFRLTERPGLGSCGSGTGQTARAAFRVRDKLITDWLRVQDLDPAPASPS
jgi:hypothetical protein